MSTFIAARLIKVSYVNIGDIFQIQTRMNLENSGWPEIQGDQKIRRVTYKDANLK